MFFIVCFLAFRSCFSAQAESSWHHSHEAAFSLRIWSIYTLPEFGDEILRQEGFESVLVKPLSLANLERALETYRES